eukprot:gene14130-biopygen3607
MSNILYARGEQDARRGEARPSRPHIRECWRARKPARAATDRQGRQPRPPEQPGRQRLAETARLQAASGRQRAASGSGGPSDIAAGVKQSGRGADPTGDGGGHSRADAAMLAAGG